MFHVIRVVRQHRWLARTVRSVARQVRWCRTTSCLIQSVHSTPLHPILFDIRSNNDAHYSTIQLSLSLSLSLSSTMSSIFTHFKLPSDFEAPADKISPTLPGLGSEVHAVMYSANRYGICFALPAYPGVYAFWQSWHLEHPGNLDLDVWIPARVVRVADVTEHYTVVQVQPCQLDCGFAHGKGKVEQMRMRLKQKLADKKKNRV
jgi:hypothetical protein